MFVASQLSLLDGSLQTVAMLNALHDKLAGEKATILKDFL